MSPFTFIAFRRHAPGCCRQGAPRNGEAACLKHCFPALMKSEVAFSMSPGMTCSVDRIGIDSTPDYFASAQARRAPCCSSRRHSFVDDSVHVKLTSEELQLEVVAEALEAGMRRTHELCYKIRSEGVERIDPVALQPQDFVHEWMIRPWDEMQSRSSDAVAPWHKFLHADLVFGGYDFVQPCIDRPGFTEVGVELKSLGDREIPEPLPVYFLIQDKGNYSYEMSEISFEPHDDCPGEAPPADYNKFPSLFKKN